MKRRAERSIEQQKTGLSQFEGVPVFMMNPPLAPIYVPIDTFLLTWSANLCTIVTEAVTYESSLQPKLHARGN